jgi:uncharacterized membrane protein
MVSLTALVLTITSVVVQLAMGQFSPRSVRPFLQDRPSQFAIGVFVGAFAHAMFAMREVRSAGSTGSVPGITIVTSYVLVFVSVVVLVAYVHHIGNSLKVDSIIASVGGETRQLFERLYPTRLAREHDDDRDGPVITSGEAGFGVRIDHERLVDIATDAEATLVMERSVGEFVPEGGPMFRVEPDSARPDPRDVRGAIAIRPERTMDQDGAFGLQTLVDICERSLSDDFNDQTTAAQAIDRIHDLMRVLARRKLPSGRFRDGGGALRLVTAVPGWDDYVRIAFDDIYIAGAGSSVVKRRLRAVLEELASFAPKDRKSPIQERLEAWDLGEGTDASQRTTPAA